MQSLPIDRFLNELLSQIEPPLDPVVYRVGFAIIPATYFFLTDMLSYILFLFLGTSKGLETIEPIAVHSATDISLL